MNEQNNSRLRIIAGPNGSGKSTLFDKLKDLHIPLGIELNADEIEKKLKINPFINFEDFDLIITQQEFDTFIQTQSGFINLLKDSASIENASIQNNTLNLEKSLVNSYLAALITEFIRWRLLEESKSFTFETVLSHPSKITFIQQAQEKGFKTYLYYVSTTDVTINKQRVKVRVNKGGHPVPENKIESRYYKSMELLLETIKVSNRAYIFDNSSDKLQWIAEITDGKFVDIKISEDIPWWVDNYLIKKIS